MGDKVGDSVTSNVGTGDGPKEGRGEYCPGVMWSLNGAQVGGEDCF